MRQRRVILAEYFTAEDRTLLFLVREDFLEPIVKEIHQTTAQIRDFVTEYFQSEPATDRHSRKSTSDKVRDLPEDEFQAFLHDFISPLIELDKTGNPITQPGDIVWFVPHDFLHYLPLHVVKLGEQYLGDRNPVCYTPSASVMKYCHQKRKGKREKALIMGDPMIYTRDQTLAIQSLFTPGAAELHIEDATIDLLKRKLSETRADIDILHIACHGNFDSEQALQSGIILPDGRLTAEDIFALEMKVDLVTLSACESGINENKPGDELIGLTRALIYAGTPSVIVSIWEVDAISTSILMTHFYQKIIAGATKVDALQQAQVELRTMTIEIAIAYYTATQKRLPDPIDQRQLQWDIADLHYNVGDMGRASELYEVLRQTATPNSLEIAKIDNLVLRCELREGSIPKRYPYAHPYFWAPFVLIGYWR